jgi:hypothetical protein
MEGDKLMVNIVGKDPVIPVQKEKRERSSNAFGESNEPIRKRFCLG